MPISFCESDRPRREYHLNNIFSRYMDDAAILEEGTHNELIKRGGGYAKIWNLQAQAFLP